MAVNLISAKAERNQIDSIWSRLSGLIKLFLDFISFFSPLIIWKNITHSRSEWTDFSGYLLSILTLVLAWTAIYLFDRLTATYYPYLFLLAPVFINALYGGLGPALFSTLTGVFIANLAFNNFLLTKDLFSFNLTNLAFIIEALIISSVTIWQKRRQQAVTLSLLQEHTARVKAQNVNENLKRLERQKDDFIAIAAHELKNPLASAKAFSQILQQKAGTRSEKKYHLMLGRQIDRLEQMVTQLFDVSSMSAGKISLRMHRVNFDELVMTIIIDLQHTISSHHLVVQGHTKAEIDVDPDRIREVLVNLISNAVKYSPQADQVVVHLSSTHNQVIISIKDFGQGISLQDQKRIFERFYRAQSQEVSGLGLGLYIASEIVKNHGGRIWLESKMGQGSTFFVSLPKNKF